MDKLSRKDYKTIKTYNNEQMTKYLEGVYRKAWTNGFKAGQEAKTNKRYRVEHEIDKTLPFPAPEYNCAACKHKLFRGNGDNPKYCEWCGVEIAWPDMSEIEAAEEEAEEDGE